MTAFGMNAEPGGLGVAGKPTEAVAPRRDPKTKAVHYELAAPPRTAAKEPEKVPVPVDEHEPEEAASRANRVRGPPKTKTQPRGAGLGLSVLKSVSDRRLTDTTRRGKPQGICCTQGCGGPRRRHLVSRLHKLGEESLAYFIAEIERDFAVDLTPKLKSYSELPAGLIHFVFATEGGRA